MKNIHRIIKCLLVVIAGIIVLYMLGPAPSKPLVDSTLPPIESDVQILESQIAESENHTVALKPDNQARIIWADSTKKRKTPFSVVYLHGLGGSQGDGLRVHAEFSRRYGCTTYIFLVCMGMELIHRTRFETSRPRTILNLPGALSALVSVKSLLSYEMNPETFSRIHQPLFVGYYYKNESTQDNRVSVPRILQMFDQIGTPPAVKRKVAFPNAGAHPIASSIMARDIDSVRMENFKFAEEVLKLVPISKQQQYP